MTEDQIRQIVGEQITEALATWKATHEEENRQIIRAELRAVEEEKAQAQADSDDMMEEIAERRRKRDQRERDRTEEERRLLQSRVNDLEWEAMKNSRTRF